MLLFIVRFLVTEAWGINGAPETWIDKVLQLPWITPDIKTWILQRAAKFGRPASGQSRADNTAALWQCLPGSALGYFDDGIFLGHQVLPTQPPPPPSFLPSANSNDS